MAIQDEAGYRADVQQAMVAGRGDSTRGLDVTSKQIPAAIHSLLAAIERLEDESQVLSCVIALKTMDVTGSAGAPEPPSQSCVIATELQSVVNRINVVSEKLRSVEL